jgi:predicted N-acetyltransferase YhbS
MFDITTERPEDSAGIETLLDAAFGANRHDKISYRYRDGAAPVPELRLVARERHRPGGYGVIGTLRFWPVAIGAAADPALLLGPLAVAADWRRRGIGAGLIRQGLDMAAWARHRLVLLVGDQAYYGRFGFAPASRHGIVMPGENPDRLLARALCFGAFGGVGGPVMPWRPVRGAGGLGGAIAA